ncbi:hypothetical protein ACS0TY_004299 [Phlomoides rotata]
MKRTEIEWYPGKCLTHKVFFGIATYNDSSAAQIITVLTRINSLTGVAYKDDSTILAWELINEPRCQSDVSGKTIQDWVVEMASYVKSIDKNHLLDIGLEGFYGAEKKQINPGAYEVGTDFISNNKIPLIDFATIHIYPETWLPDDSGKVLRKPLLVTEFGKSSKSPGYDVGKRNTYFDEIFNNVYNCARSGGPCGGALFWQVMTLGMEAWFDGYEVVLEQNSTTVAVISKQSRRITSGPRLQTIS